MIQERKQDFFFFTILQTNRSMSLSFKTFIFLSKEFGVHPLIFNTEAVFPSGERQPANGFSSPRELSVAEDVRILLPNTAEPCCWNCNRP